MVVFAVMVLTMVNKPLLYSVFKTAFGTSLANPADDISIRIRLQKIAYFAQTALEMPIGAVYSLYLHGPYSPEIARVYYEDNFLENVSKAREIPEHAGILKTLASKPTDWLELAATYYSFTRAGLDMERAISRAADIKGVPIDTVRIVAGELESLLKSA